MTTIVKYPVDYSGVKSNNLVLSETRDLIGLNKKLIAPRYGAFYENNLEVRDFYTNAVLVPHVDYVVAQIEPTATERSGLSVFQFILIKNLTTTKIRFNYQVVGGPYSLSPDAIAEFITMLEGDDRQIAWGDIIGTPSDFPPTNHMHDANDLYGLEDVVVTLESLRVAILSGDNIAQENTINYVFEQIAALKSTVFSGTLDALEGTKTDIAMSPYTTKLAILTALSGMAGQSSNLEFSTSVENDAWGYIRDPITGTTLCFGSSIDLAPESIYRVNFKRIFNNIPLVISGDIQSTTDASSTGSQWVEVIAKIPQHTIDQTGFVAVGRRLSGTNTDTARLKYLAIGISDSNQPTTFTEGYATTMPALPAQAVQPAWSGTNSITAVNTLPIDSKRVGIVFAAGISGGGYSFNSNAMTAVTNFYYTAFPGSFVDNNYEVKGVAEVPDDDSINMNYIGVSLDAWHDLSALKAAGATSTNAGFMWTASGVYGGQIRLTVTIRTKAQPYKTASRVFYIGQSSAAYDPSVMPANAVNSGINLNAVSYNTSASSLKPLSISFAAGINEFNFKNSFAINKSTDGNPYETPVIYGYYGPTGDASTVQNNAALYEVKVVPPIVDGFSLVNTELPFNQWIGLEVLRDPSNATQEFTMELTGANSALKVPVYIYIRHKYDHVKQARFVLGVNKIGTAITPSWIGNSSVVSFPLVNNNKTFTLDVSLASPAGIAVIHATAGGNVKSEYLSYTNNIDYWDESEYQSSCRVISSIVTGGSLTATGLPLSTWDNSAGAVYSWSGVNPTDGHMQLVIELTIRHKVLTSATAVKVFTFDLYGFGYTP